MAFSKDFVSFNIQLLTGVVGCNKQHIRVI